MQSLDDRVKDICIKSAILMGNEIKDLSWYGRFHTRRQGIIVAKPAEVKRYGNEREDKR